MHFLESVVIAVQVWKQPKVWQGFVKCCEVSFARRRNFCYLTQP